MTTTNRRWYSGMASTEDWWAVWLGLFLFAVSLISIWGFDPVGWMARPRAWEWTNLTSEFAWAGILRPAGAAYGGWHPLALLLATYVVFTGLLSIGAWFQGLDIRRFVSGFTVLFILTWACWLVGNEMHLATIDAAQNGRNAYLENDLGWGLQLGDGAAYLLALIAGLLIGNFAKGFAAFLKEAAKPEWFIKTAIVFLGIKLGVMTVDATSFALDLILTGAAATFVAYLLFWPIVYALARRVFKLRRDASAVLASGISICGVSAAIATAGAIRAKPIVPVTVSMLVVIFAMFELIILPGAYVAFAPDEPIVNGAAMGMTVKTDGADAAAGALLDELMIGAHLQATGRGMGRGLDPECGAAHEDLDRCVYRRLGVRARDPVGLQGRPASRPGVDQSGGNLVPLSEVSSSAISSRGWGTWRLPRGSRAISTRPRSAPTRSRARCAI